MAYICSRNFHFNISFDCMKRYFLLIIITILTAIPGLAQTGETFGDAVRFEKTVHDFGTLKLGSGAVECSFGFENISSSPMAVYNVVTSCGCATIDYTKEPIMPNGKGEIRVRYTNDEGPYPFDKTITVYMSNYTRPILLRIRGVCVDKEKSLSEIYTVAYGSFAMRKTEYSIGNIDQGKSKGDEAYVANTSGQPVKVDFTSVTPGLEISVSPNPIPANSTAKMTFKANTASGMWGKTAFTTVPRVNGKTYGNQEPVTVRCFVKEDFSKMSEEQLKKAPLPIFRNSSYTFDPVSKGTAIKGTFTLKNQGHSDLKIHKIESDADDVVFPDIEDIAPGESREIGFTFDTSDRTPGEEVLIITTLTTNSPTRPMINIFIQGYIK